MSLDVAFHNKLVSLVDASVPVSENYVSEDKGQPRVWWQRSTSNVELLLSGQLSLVDTNYNVEVFGSDIDATASIADALKSSLHGFRGQMGDSFVLGMFVTDHSDEYLPRNIDTDDGFHGFSFAVQVHS